MPKLCRECDSSKLLINGATVTWICKKSGRHKNFADTCDLTKTPTTPHPFLGTLDSYIEAARCKVLTDFQKMHQK
jgi:hypothetical protein